MSSIPYHPQQSLLLHPSNIEMCTSTDLLYAHGEWLPKHLHCRILASYSMICSSAFLWSMFRSKSMPGFANWFDQFHINEASGGASDPYHSDCSCLNPSRTVTRPHKLRGILVPVLPATSCRMPLHSETLFSYNY